MSEALWLHCATHPAFCRNNFIAVEEGVFSANSGTSGAAPTVASIITLVNDARLAAGKKPVGQ